MPNPTCTNDGCEKPARSRKADLCPMHYHRQYRHGSTEKVATGGPSVSNGRRYRITHVPLDHPLARATTSVYVHRLVVWETHGPGPVDCHYCSLTLHWDLPKGHPEAVTVDHVNDHGDDNRPENVVPCCRSCNAAKAGARKHAALSAAGWWSGQDTVARTGRGRVMFDAEKVTA